MAGRPLRRARMNGVVEDALKSAKYSDLPKITAMIGKLFDEYYALQYSLRSGELSGEEAAQAEKRLGELTFGIKFFSDVQDKIMEKSR